MRLVIVAVLGAALAASTALGTSQDKQDEFDPAKVNRLIVALSEDPSQEAKVVELHDYLKKHGKLALVYAKFEESFERRPKDAKLRYLLARMQLRDGNRAGAVKSLQSAALADPDYPYTWLAQAELCQERGDEKGLVSALEGVIQSSREKPAVAGAVRKLAAYYGKKQDLERIASLWAALGERYPEDPELLGEALRGILAAGRLPRARECLRAALSKNLLAPAERARFFLELAALERRTGGTAEAARALASASEAAGDDPVLGRKIDESILAFHRDENKLAELADKREKELALRPSDPLRIWRLARVYIAQTSPSRARELLAEALKQSPGHPLLMTTLAEVAAIQGKFTEVRDLSRALAQREPSQREHRKRQALACLELADFEEAEQAFGSYAVSASELAEVGQIYERRSRLAEAAIWYRRSLDLQPEPALSRTLVGLLVRLDRVPEADEETARCCAGDRERWALLRELLTRRGEPAKACVYAKKDADANPKDFGAQLALAKLQGILQHSEAESTFRKALAVAKKAERGEAYEELAHFVANQGPAAILILRAELRAKIAEEPGEGGYYYALYRLPSGADGRGPNPVRILEEGRKNDPRHVRVRQELGPYYAHQKQYDVAIDVYRELLEIDPGRRDVYAHAIGEIYWSLGHKEEAFSWWSKVNGTGKDKVGIAFQMAKKYESEKRYPQAIELLEQILREEPEGILYHWALAQMYRQVNKYEGIEREYKWILAYAKDEGYLRTARQVLAEKLAERGRALVEEGKHPLALEAFIDALRYAPDEPATGTMLALIARTCEQVRDYARAADYYHQILFKYPTVLMTVSAGRTMNAGLFASLQLRATPECLQAYEDAVGAQAKALLVAALQKSDRAGLERVIAGYPLTAAAGAAQYSLAEMFRREGDKARAAASYERLLAEFSLVGIDESLVRVRLVELAAQLKDWGVLSTHLGELVARFKEQTLSVDGRPLVVKDFIKTWQKELITHGVGLGATWGLLGRDSRNSSSIPQDFAPPLIPKWKYAACPASNSGMPQTLPPIYAAAGLVFLAKEDVVVALDASTGAMRWTAPLRVQRARNSKMNAAVNSPPAIEGRLAVSQGVLVGIDGDNEIRAVEAATGANLWSHVSDLARADGTTPGKSGNRVRTGTTLPLIEHLEVLSATRQCFLVREADKLRAYSIRTGRLEWQADLQGNSLPIGIDPGPPGSGTYPEKLERAVLESDGVVVHAYGDSIRALDTLSGRSLWEVKIPGKGSAGPSPWAPYFTIVTEGVARATISGDLLIFLSAVEGKLTALELRTGRPRWEMPGEGPATEGQLASDDQVVYALGNKSLAAFSIRTGERHWRRDVRMVPPGNRQGLPALAAPLNRMSVAGARIFFVSGEDQTGATAKLEAIERKNGTTVWEYAWEPIGKMIQGMPSLGIDAWGRPIPSQISAPVLCDGWMYVVRSDGQLTAFHGKSQELASLREIIRTDPESPMAHFRLGDLLGSEGSTSLEIEEYRTALKLAQKKPDTAALREMVTEAKARLFVRFMRQGEASADLEAALKAFVEARGYAEGESATARVLVRTAAVLLALKREVEALDALSSIMARCASSPSPLEGAAETAGEYARRQMARLGPQARAQWEKAHAEEMEKAFAAGKSLEELEKAIDRFSFSAKADQARIRAARAHFDQKRYKEALLTLDRMRPEFLEQADAESFFDAYDLLSRSLAALGEDRRALGTVQKMLSEIAKDGARLGSLKERAEARHKEMKESWERNGTFSTPLKTVWVSPAPLAGAPKPAGPTMEAFRPAVDCGKIYLLDLQGNLQATDAGSGELAWQAKTEDFSAFFLQGPNNLTVLPQDPLMVVHNGLVVVGGKSVRAFDGAGGKLLWTMPSVDADGFVHQVLIEGNRVLTCETKGRISVRDDRSGKLVWSNRPGASASGIISDRSGTSGGGLVYPRLGVDGTRVVAQPAGDPGSLYAYDLAGGKLAWKMVDAAYPGYLKGRVLLDVGYGAACLADPSGLVVCHELADGKVRWKLNLSQPVDALLATPERLVVATSEQVAVFTSKTGKKEWSAPADSANQTFSRDKDMRIGATSLDAKGRWLVVGSAASVSIFELASGQLKDQIRPESQPSFSKPAGKAYPFGKSFASVVVGPEGIFWGLPTEYGAQWSLLR